MPKKERSHTKFSELNHGNDDEFKDWVQSSNKCENSFRCKFCKKTYELGSMGKSALRSHASGKKHQRLVAAARSSPSVFAFVSQSQSVARRTDAVPQPVSDTTQSPEAPTSIVPSNGRSNGTVTHFMHSPS